MHFPLQLLLGPQNIMASWLVVVVQLIIAFGIGTHSQDNECNVWTLVVQFLI
jgi:hypothetical protein